MASPLETCSPPSASQFSPACCQVCGGTLRTRYATVHDTGTGDSFSIEACDSCGLGHTQPVPSDWERYYPPAYHGGRHGSTAAYCVRRRMGWVQKIAGKARGRNLLDIGCGDGAFLLRARQQGWRVAGTELKPETARQSGLDVRTTLAEVAEIGPMDCVTLWHSLEHMVDPVATLRSAVALLQPEGFALIAVPDAGGLQASAFAEDWLHLDVPRHLFHFTRASLLRLAETSGLRTLRMWHQEFEYDLLGWSQSALNRMCSTPNVYFDQLRGRPPVQGAPPRILTGAGGMVLSACALPLVPLGTLLGRGGTLILAAQKTGLP